MFSLRKRSLTIALTVVSLLAMLAPAAIAAPDVLHGITIDRPTTADSAYLDGSESLTVDFTLTINDLQVDDVWVVAELLDAYGNNHGTGSLLVGNETLVTGANPFTWDDEDDFPNGVEIVNIGGNDGWYDLKVCAFEADFPPDEAPLWCDFEENAVLLDRQWPKVWLDKPEAGAWVTNGYLMVGGAKDKWGLDNDTAVFEYCVYSNLWTPADGTTLNCGPDDNSWIWIADGTPTGVVNDGVTEFSGVWDSTLVPDDLGAIRFCIKDLVGHESCAANVVGVDNRYKISLHPGWNLISTPLMLYDADVEDVLKHLILLGKVEQVVTFNKATGTWSMWSPAAGPDSLTKIDHGKGYWIKMIGEGDLEFVGTWKNVGAESPPEYGVGIGWNLIGYTHWGRPTVFPFPASTAGDYLDGVGGIQALYRYDAGAELFVPVFDAQPMTLGAGFWLATTDAGTIRP